MTSTRQPTSTELAPLSHPDQVARDTVARARRQGILVGLMIAVALAIIVAPIAIQLTSKGHHRTPLPPKPVHHTRAHTTPPPPPTTPAPPADVTDGLAKLADQHRLDWGPDGPPDSYQTDSGRTVGTGSDVGTVSVGGKPDSNSISDRLLYDGSGFGWLQIVTFHQYTSLDGIVGIDDGTPCPHNKVIVHIEDQDRKPLWGPVTVAVDQPRAFHLKNLAAISDLRLVNELLRPNVAGGSDCDQGDADPAWANLTLTGPPH